MTNEATVSLQMIIKDETKKVTALLKQALPYFDAINLTVSDSKSAKVLAHTWEKNRKVKVVHRPWTDDFSEARNANMQLCTTDYFFWLDADDLFDFSAIPELVNYAATEGYEAIYLPYNYAKDEHGRVVAVHYRERLVDNRIGFEWRGALHETLIIDRQFRAKRLESPVVEHDSPDIGGSIERNHKILESKVVDVPNPDARYVHYLGLSYFTKGDYAKAIETLARYIQVGGWDEEIYRSLIKMSEASSMLNRDQDAKNYALQAAGVTPDYPQAYFCLAQYEFADAQWKECLEWLKVAFSKPQPKTMSVVDPTMVERGKIMGASAEFQLGNYRQAAEVLKTTNDPARAELEEIFELEASKERFIEILPAILKHVDKQKVYDGLQEDLKYDQRLQWLRNLVVKPKKWTDNSIVFFVGKGYEEWGPHTLDKGMGGSEEAIVYLTRELAKIGFEVVVYGAVNEPIIDNESGKLGEAVTWLPWRMFDTRDEFDTLVVWRAPHGVDKLKARVKILDIHDKLDEKDIVPYEDVTYFFKTNYHRELYPKVQNAVVIGNGIKKDQF